MAPAHLRTAYNDLLTSVKAKREQCARRIAQMRRCAAIALRLRIAKRIAPGWQILINGYRWIVRRILAGGLFLCDSIDERCPLRFRHGTTLSAGSGSPMGSN